MFCVNFFISSVHSIKSSVHYAKPVKKNFPLMPKKTSYVVVTHLFIIKTYIKNVPLKRI